MDKTGRANGPYRRLKNAQQAETIRREPPPLPMRGPYYSGMVDFPWASEHGAEGDQSGRAYRPYPTVTPEQAAAMPVPSILQADASVWMWIPNFHLMHGCHLRIAAAWGLRRPGCTVFNLYRPPLLVPKRGVVSPWVENTVRKCMARTSSTSFGGSRTASKHHMRR